MNNSTTSDESSNDEEEKAIPKVACAAVPDSGDVKPARKRGRRTKVAKAQAAVTKNPKKLAPLPSRALNAYNIFFREERKRWIEQRQQSSESGAGKPSTVSAHPPFAEMGKIIGQKWKELPANKKKRFENLAKEDMQRYRREVDEYKSKLIQETTKSAETLGSDTVSSAWNYGSSSSEDDTDRHSKPAASSEASLQIPSNNRSQEVASCNPNFTGSTFLHGYHPFDSSQINSQNQMHNLLNHVLHNQQAADVPTYSQQQHLQQQLQQQQLLSILLPRLNQQQQQQQQQHQEAYLLHLANTHLSHEYISATALASALERNRQIPNSSLSQLQNSVPSIDWATERLLQGMQWQRPAHLPLLAASPSISSNLELQLRVSAFLRQQQQQLQLQSSLQSSQHPSEDIGRKPPPQPPSES